MRIFTVAFIGGIVGTVFASFAVFAWTGPTGTAPNSNVAAPINVSSTDQVKSAALGVNGLAIFGNGILQANSYLNWGATSGSSGYGIRDTDGLLEFKNTDGDWSSIQSTIFNLSGGMGGAGQWATTTAETGIQYTVGNVGIGAAPAATVNSLDIRETDTSTAGGKYNFYNQMTLTPPSAASGAYIAGQDVISLTGANGVSGSIQGGRGQVTHSGSGLLNAGYGLFGQVLNNSTGVMTTGYGGWHDVQNSANGGSIGTAYGSYNRAYNANTSGIGMAGGTGSYNLVSNAGAGTITNAFGSQSVAGNASSGSITTAYGAFGSAQNTNTGTITTARGVHARINNSSTGSITNAYSLYADFLNQGGGAVTNWYGLYVPALAGTAPTTGRYPLYVADTGSSYFAGGVGIGDATPDGSLKLDVQGQVGATEYCDASGIIVRLRQTWAERRR